MPPRPLARPGGVATNQQGAGRMSNATDTERDSVDAQRLQAGWVIAHMLRAGVLGQQWSRLQAKQEAVETLKGRS